MIKEAKKIVDKLQVKFKSIEYGIPDDNTDDPIDIDSLGEIRFLARINKRDPWEDMVFGKSSQDKFDREKPVTWDNVHWGNTELDLDTEHDNADIFRAIIKHYPQELFNKFKACIPHELTTLLAEQALDNFSILKDMIDANNAM